MNGERARPRRRNEEPSSPSSAFVPTRIRSAHWKPQVGCGSPAGSLSLSQLRSTLALVYSRREVPRRHRSLASPKLFPCSHRVALLSFRAIRPPFRPPLRPLPWPITPSIMLNPPASPAMGPARHFFRPSAVGDASEARRSKVKRRGLACEWPLEWLFHVSGGVKWATQRLTHSDTSTKQTRRSRSKVHRQGTT